MHKVVTNILLKDSSTFTSENIVELIRSRYFECLFRTSESIKLLKDFYVSGKLDINERIFNEFRCGVLQCVLHNLVTKPHLTTELVDFFDWIISSDKLDVTIPQFGQQYVNGKYVIYERSILGYCTVECSKIPDVNNIIVRIVNHPSFVRSTITKTTTE